MLKRTIILLISLIFTFNLYADRPKVALVLSGGGARGTAHIGVISELEKLGIPIDAVYGTSIGAMIGALYATGYSPGDMIRMMDHLNMMQKLNFDSEKPIVKNPPFVKNTFNILSLGQKDGEISGVESIYNDSRMLLMLNRFYSKFLGDIDFQKDLLIPFKSVAVDIKNKRKYIFDSGSLVDAVRASVSIPFVFPPLILDDKVLVDGGLLDNLPINLAKEDGYDYIIAVDLGSDDDNSAYFNILDIASAVMSTVVRASVKMQIPNADIYIDTQVKGGVLDFNKSKGFVKVGEQSIKPHLEKLAKDFKEYLEPKDPQRIGSYFLENESQYIKNIRYILDNKEVENKRIIDLYNIYFDEFKNKELDDDNLDLLERKLSLFHKSSEFYKYNYRLIDGELFIYFTSYNDNEYRYELGLGGFLDVNFNFQKNTYPININYNIKLNFTFNLYENIDDYPFLFKVETSVEHKFNLNLLTKFILLPWLQLELSNDIGLGKVLQASFYASNLVPVDIQIKPEFRLIFTPYRNLRIGLIAAVDIVFENRAVMKKDVYVHPYAELQIYSSDRSEGLLLLQGYRFDSIMRLGKGFYKAGYALTFNYEHDFRITPSSIIGYTLALSTFRSEDQNQVYESYFDIGGFSKVIGLPVKSYRQDYAFLALRWDYELLNVGFPIIISLRGSIAGVRKDLFIYTQSPPFSLIDTIQGGFGLGFGTKTPIGDIILGFGFSSNLDLNIYVGLS